MHFNTLIIMNEDTVGYGNRSRKPTGYCKLTMPNRIICYVQGLRQLPRDQKYKLYLTSKNKQKAVEAGTFQVGASGNKETRWNMEPSNIANSGINARDVDGALIVVEGDNSKDRIVPLLGFTSEPYGWEELIDKGKAEELAPKEVAQETVKEAVNEERSKKEEENKEIIALKAEVSRLKEIIAQSEKAKENKEETTGINEYVSDFVRKYETSDIIEQKEGYKEIGSVFEKRIPINPFEAKNTGIKWVRITLEDLEALPLLERDWVNQPLIERANRDYKHFILGRDELKLTYYIGIPGVYNSNKTEALNIDKIERFSCCHNIQPKTGEVGYWIARIQ
ncbi:MAG: hypothetical protein GX366_03015 [Epulopiscium sp.]|nr:hypothetical protein [Candidatus Epulonipiscium sp.]